MLPQLSTSAGNVKLIAVKKSRRRCPIEVVLTFDNAVPTSVGGPPIGTPDGSRGSNASQRFDSRWVRFPTPRCLRPRTSVRSSDRREATRRSIECHHDRAPRHRWIFWWVEGLCRFPKPG